MSTYEQQQRRTRLYKMGAIFWPVHRVWLLQDKDDVLASSQMGWRILEGENKEEARKFLEAKDEQSHTRL